MLFRKPVKGDFIIYKGTNSVSYVSTDWDDLLFKKWKNTFSFVEVTPVEPPENKGNYYNLYQSCDGGKVYPGGISGYLTRKDADHMGQAENRVACVDLNQLKGRFDD